MKIRSALQPGFSHFADELAGLGEQAVGAREFSLGAQGPYALQYIPFEHVNRAARLVIVGITPGMNQLRLAYAAAQQALRAGKCHAVALEEIKRAGAFGGSAMRPNLLKMLRHFRFDKILGVDDVASLWGPNAHLLHTTSVVPHAAFKKDKMFAGSFDEVLGAPLLHDSFERDFLTTLPMLSGDAIFVALGPCPLAALGWCVERGFLRRAQVLGAFCHPSSSGGSMTRYYLREVARSDLDPRDPVRGRCDWLDESYRGMKSGTDELLVA